jgi:hypothetical protein
MLPGNERFPGTRRYQGTFKLESPLRQDTGEKGLIISLSSWSRMWQCHT